MLFFQVSKLRNTGFIKRCFLIIMAGALLVGCDSVDSVSKNNAKVNFKLSAEDSAVDGFSGSEFEDAWQVSFEHVYVQMDQVILSHNGEADTTLALKQVYDLHLGEPVLGAGLAVSADRYDVSFNSKVATAVMRYPETMSKTMKDEMIAAKSNFWVIGKGVKDEQTVSFSLLFEIPFEAAKCINGIDQTQGIIAELNGESEVEITLHLEHMFYQSLDQFANHIEGMPTALRFGGIAKAAGQDMVATVSDLKGMSLSDLPDYDSETSSVDNLYDFMKDSLLQMAHLNGEGACQIK